MGLSGTALRFCKVGLDRLGDKKTQTSWLYVNLYQRERLDSSAHMNYENSEYDNLMVNDCKISVQNSQVHM